MRAAVPKYVGKEFSKAPPGHRFRLYFPVWKDHGWDIEKQKKNEAVQQVVDMRPVQPLVEAIASRRDVLAGNPGCLVSDAISTAPFVTGMGMEHPLENGFAFLDPYGVPYLPGSSVKGVLRRAAEELALFEADSGGWTLPAVWWLFGFDASSGFFSQGGNEDPEPVREERKRWRDAYAALIETLQGSADFSPQEATHLLAKFRTLVDDKDTIARDDATFLKELQKSKAARTSIHTRGSLAFWDVIPVPGEGDAANLRVDIMNPHYGHYYQGKEPPHDAGSPNPIFYLTVPPGWRFTFTVQLLPVRKLPEWFREPVDGTPRWKHLLEAALQHAFDWLGFGAKTSLGYGTMTRDKQAEERRAEENARKAREEERRRLEEERRAAEEAERRRREAMTPLERALETLRNADHDTFIKVFGRLDEFQNKERCHLAQGLKSWMQEHNEWKVKKKTKKWDRVQKIKAILGEAPCNDEN